ncbi:MAG: A/G-specific adenine glycosylase [Acidobacteriia bacterium]|nr:A/G-specific adenine glycosylase [Terriglobia bacterium]
MRPAGNWRTDVASPAPPAIAELRSAWTGEGARPHTSRGACPSTSGDLGRFRRALLRWYDQHRRELPWRKTRDPYRIWLSEIMLQQTRVAAVVEHYRIFLKRFPNVQALAAATEDAVLAAWSGLGYYRRARMLCQSARELVRMHGGRFPQTAEALQALPGIGRYTAAAIASIAFAEPVAVVDVNVERVLQRLTGIDLATPQTWQHARALLATSRPGDFNQAMMELGATVCLPRQPRCPSCPVRKWCVNQPSNFNQGANGTITMEGSAPQPGGTLTQPSSRRVKKEIWCVLNQRNGSIRLVQRPRKSQLMPGMWELPQLPQKRRPTPVRVVWRTFRHSITVTDYTVHVHRGRTARGQRIPVADISRFPLTGLTRKILKAASVI